MLSLVEAPQLPDEGGSLLMRNIEGIAHLRPLGQGVSERRLRTQRQSWGRNRRREQRLVPPKPKPRRNGEMLRRVLLQRASRTENPGVELG